MNAVITESYEGTLIPFQTGDAFVNATEMCKHFGKRPGDFLDIGPTKEFLAALSQQENKLPAALVVKIEGRNGGTWLHPDLALECARWLSPKFAIWCNRVIRSILAGEVVFGKRHDSFPEWNPAVNEMFALMEQLEKRGVGHNTSATVASEMIRSSAYQGCRKPKPAKEASPVQSDLFGATSANPPSAPPRRYLRFGVSPIRSRQKAAK
jgi:hypothetical protein